MTPTDVISLDGLAAQLQTPWSPLDVTQVNGSIVRLVRLQGRFNWHHHEEDELFIGHQGRFTIELEEHQPAVLGPGDCYLVRAGVEHRPVAADPAYALLIVEPRTRHDFGVAASA